MDLRTLLNIATIAVSMVCLVVAAVIFCADLIVLWMDQSSDEE